MLFYSIFLKVRDKWNKFDCKTVYDVLERVFYPHLRVVH